MSELIRIFGRDVLYETLRAEITAIEDGFTVTVLAILDGDDVLCAHTEAASPATLSDATEKMLPAAAAAVKQWITDHADAVSVPSRRDPSAMSDYVASTGTEDHAEEANLIADIVSRVREAGTGEYALFSQRYGIAHELLRAGFRLTAVPSTDGDQR